MNENGDSFAVFGAERSRILVTAANVVVRTAVHSGVSGGFLVARKSPPPAMIFLNQWGGSISGTDLHQPLKFATFGNPRRITLDTPLVHKAILVYPTPDSENQIYIVL